MLEPCLSGVPDTAFSWGLGEALSRGVRAADLLSANRRHIVISFDFSHRIGLVTGASGGVGIELVERLSKAGASVIATDTAPSQELLKVLKSTEPGLFVQADLLVQGDFSRLVSTVHEVAPSLDFLVACAALTADSESTGYIAPFEEQTLDAFVAALHLNLAVPFELVRCLLPNLRRSELASFVSVGSIYGVVGPDTGIYEGTQMNCPAGYAASKAGLLQLTRYFASVLGPEVRANCVSPGGIRRGQPDQFQRRYEERTPLGRMATETDVVNAIMWLLDEASQYITGQNVLVDGGWTVW